jgi:uncharacterized membrane protein YhiD involved in acid resistance
VVGLERGLSAQPAGLRTHVLVSLGAALFAVAGGPRVPPHRSGGERPEQGDG